MSFSFNYSVLALAAARTLQPSGCLRVTFSFVVATKRAVSTEMIHFNDMIIFYIVKDLIVSGLNSFLTEYVGTALPL